MERATIPSIQLTEEHPLVKGYCSSLTDVCFLLNVG